MRRSYTYLTLTAAIALALSGYVIVSGLGLGNLANGTGSTLPIGGGILDTADSLGGKQSGNDNNNDSLGNNAVGQNNLSPAVNILGNSGVTTSEDIQVYNSGSNSNGHRGTSSSIQTNSNDNSLLPADTPSSNEGCTDTANGCFEFVVPESPVGIIALMGSSLAVLGGFAYFSKAKNTVGL